MVVLLSSESVVVLHGRSPLQVLKSLPLDQLRGKLIVDVLSVKVKECPCLDNRGHLDKALSYHCHNHGYAPIGPSSKSYVRDSTSGL